MNNGVFLCLKCAGIHRGFGMSVSLIRSLQEDTWTEKQLLYRETTFIFNQRRKQKFQK